MGKFDINLPLHQGDLDGLCGIYAIINSIKALYPKRFNDRNQSQLFEYLTNYAIKEQGNLNILSEGLGLRDMQQLLNAALEYLSSDLYINVQVTRPWRKQSSTLPTHTNIKELLKTPKTAILIGLEKPSLHWTVITDYSHGEFVLYDSDEHENIPSNELLFTRKQKALYDGEYVIVCSAIFVLRKAKKDI
jgi:hypothetical protein